MGELGGLTIRPRQTGWFAFSPGAAWLFGRGCLGFRPVRLGLSAWAALPFGLCGLALGLCCLAFGLVRLGLWACAAWLLGLGGFAFRLVRLGLWACAAWPFGQCCLAFRPVLLGLSACAAWLFDRCSLGCRPVLLGFSPGAAWPFGLCSLAFWPVLLGLLACAACLLASAAWAFGRGGVGQRLRCGPWPFSGIRSRSGSAGSRGGRSMRA